MNPMLFIIQVNGDFYYDLFYLLAFLVGYLVLVTIGIKQQYNLTTWLLLLAGTRLFFIIGTKLFSYSTEQWQILFEDYYLPATTGKTLLGGLLLLSAGFVFLKKVFRLKTAVLDAFALVIPLSIALQRPGCFLAGCCYGNITHMPWGIQYLPGTLPHYHQFQAGLIQASDLYSLPVHPSQLYEVLNGLLVVGILVRAKQFIKAPGNTLTLSVLLYCFFRFFTEFFRSPLAHATVSTTWGGLLKMQWALLIIIALLTFCFIYREKQSYPTPSQVVPPPALLTGISLLFGIIIATWSLRDWFTFTELIALNMVLYPAIVYTSLTFFRKVTLPAYRWLAFACLSLPVLLMSQSLPVRPGKASSDSLTTSFHTIKIGYGNGNFQNSNALGQGSGCDRVRNTKYFQQEYSLVGAGYAFSKSKNKHTTTLGLNAFYGKHKETDVTVNTTSIKQENTLFGINPYAQVDYKIIGLGGGLHLGKLRYTVENLDKNGNGEPKSGSLKTPVYPQVYIRLGPIRYLFADFRLASHFPSALPGMRYQLGIGSGLGMQNGSFIRYGTTGIDQFVSGNLVFANRFALEPLYLWGTSETPYQTKQRQFSLGLHYRFNHQEKK